MRLANKWTRSPQDAEDLVQDTILLALAHQHQFKPGSNLKGWLVTIMHNQVRTKWRRKKLIVQLPEDYELTIPVPAAQLDRLLLSEALTAIASLPTIYRQAYEAIVIDDKDYEEAADLLGIDVGTVKSRVSRAIDIIESLFGERNERRAGQARRRAA